MTVYSPKENHIRRQFSSANKGERYVVISTDTGGKMFACLRKKEESEESWAMENGRRLLEESISLFDGKVNPIRCFSAREIEIATNYFHRSQPFHNRVSKLYRCSLRDQEVLVKRCTDQNTTETDYLIRDIVVSSRMSVHKNTLKLIGCCLETEAVALVYESFDCAGTLQDELFCDESDPRPVLPWKHRLKIAVDLSNLVAYLHTALPRPLIHRDFRPSNILLDKENGVVKLFDFSLCMSLPEGKSFVEVNEVEVVGTFGYVDHGYVDHEYWATGRLNEKTDVYAFGVLLLNLLSGRLASRISSNQYTTLVDDARCFVDNERFEEMLDPVLSTDEPWPGKDGQFEAFLMLALECTRGRGFDRPDMTEVGTRLIGMYRSAFSDS